MIFLYGSNGGLQTIIDDYASCLETQRWHEYSDLTAQMPASRYADVSAARYFSADKSANGTMYLIEKVEVSGGGVMTVSGRSAVVELDHRTCGYTKRITGKPWAVLSALMAPLTEARSITPHLQADPNLGSSVRVQITWGQIGERIREVLEAQGLSITAVRNSGIEITLLSPQYGGRFIGDRYRNADLGTYSVDESRWYTYAYVAGQGGGTGREVVEVSLSGERRELYVDADDLSPDDLSTAEYRELLDTRGREKLAEFSRIEVISAESDVPELGEVVRYDSDIVSEWLMCTQREIVREGGVTQYRASLGQPTPTLKKAIRRLI